MKYPTYERYKDSGVPWLGDIPESWGVKKIQHLCRLRSGAGITSEDIEKEGDYPVFGGNGIRGFTDDYTHQGEFVLIGRQGALCGNVVVAQGKFWASEHALVANPLIDYDANWLSYILDIMNLNQYSVSAAQPGLSVDNLAKLQVPYTDLPEQKSIAAYLDEKTAEIDALIAKKEALLKALAEKRAVMITNAVTKGLNPSAPVKDSGIEWLGQIPAHWDVKRFKFLLSKPLTYGANESAEFEERSDPRYIRITDVREDGSLKDETFRSLPEDVAAPYLLEDGDILMARSGATVGKTFIYKPSWGRAAFAGYLIRARINKLANPDFIYRFLNSSSYWDWLNSVFIQATIQNVSAEKYANLVMPLPNIHEQNEIVEYINKESREFDAIHRSVVNAIEKLKEYRTSLITDAVTGKIKVM